MSAIPTITLNDGTTIPQLGFGVFQIPPAETAARSARRSTSATATSTPRRCTEREGGRGGDTRLRARPRRVFVTSKLNNGFHRPDDARARLRRHLGGARAWTTSTCSSSTGRCRRSTTATSSRPGRCWRSSSRDGRARSIGVSNFQPAHLERLARRPTPFRRSTRSRRTRTSRTTRCAPTTRATASPRRRGRRSRRARCIDDPVIEDRRQGRARRPLRSRCAGTSSAATSCSPSR